MSATGGAGGAIGSAAQAAVVGALPQLLQAAEARGLEALAVLAKLGVEAAQVGSKILAKFARMAIQYGRGEIDRASAVIAADEYLLALEDLVYDEKNQALKEAYEEGKALLNDVKVILLATGSIALGVGLKVFAPFIEPYLQGMLQKALAG